MLVLIVISTLHNNEIFALTLLGLGRCWSNLLWVRTAFYDYLAEPVKVPTPPLIADIRTDCRSLIDQKRCAAEVLTNGRDYDGATKAQFTPLIGCQHCKAASISFGFKRFKSKPNQHVKGTQICG